MNYYYNKINFFNNKIVTFEFNIKINYEEFIFIIIY